MSGGPAAERVAGLPTRKRALFAAATMLLSSAALMGILELALRVVEAGSGAPVALVDPLQALRESERVEVGSVSMGHLRGMVRPSVDPEMVYELKPSRNWVFPRGEIRTNRYGFRAAEHSAEKPRGHVRLVGIGDSVMFGWGVDTGETYMSRLGRFLNAPGATLEVLNCAQPAYNATQWAANFERRCLPFAPDVLLIGYTLNDSDETVLAAPPPLDLLGHSRLFSLVRELAEQRWPPAGKRERGEQRVKAAMQRVGRLARARGIPVVLFIYPQTWGRGQAEMPKRFALENGMRYVDMFEAFDRYYARTGVPGLEALYLSPTDPHPVAEGHRVIAEALAPVLQPLVESAARQVEGGGRR